MWGVRTTSSTASTLLEVPYLHNILPSPTARATRRSGWRAATAQLRLRREPGLGAIKVQLEPIFDMKVARRHKEAAEACTGAAGSRTTTP